jgi:hypothetical protein
MNMKDGFLDCQLLKEVPYPYSYFLLNNACMKQLSFHNPFFYFVMLTIEKVLFESCDSL